MKKFPVNTQNFSIAFKHYSNEKLRKAYWLFLLMNQHYLTNVGINLLKYAIKIKFPINFLIKNTLFKHFCGGETLNESLETVELLSKYQIGTILDYSVEGKDDENSYQNTFKEVLKTIDLAVRIPNIPFCVFKTTGIVSSKILKMAQNGDSMKHSEQEELHKGKKRFEALCQAAFENNIRLLIDAEESWIQKIIDEWATAAMKKYNTKTVLIYNTVQMYKKEALNELTHSLKIAKQENYKIGIKLVRGAYLEKETEYAKNNHISSVLHSSKNDTDIAYNEGLKMLIENNHSSIILGTHNEESIQKALLLLNNLIENEEVYFAQLYGMSDNLSFNLAENGYQVSKYVPYGPINETMPYLFRRAEENSAIKGQTGREFELIKKEIKSRNMNIFIDLSHL